MVGFAVELHQFDGEMAHTARMVCSRWVSMASVNTGLRYLVTNTRWACSSDMLCRLRR